MNLLGKNNERKPKDLWGTDMLKLNTPSNVPQIEQLYGVLVRLGGTLKYK